MRPGLLGLYWNARQQSLDECADQCLRTILAMREAGFNGFFQRGRSGKAVHRGEVEMTPEALSGLLARGVCRRDDNREPIPELGWSIGLWSGRSYDESFGLDIHCGCFSESVGNNVVLTLPSSGPHSLAQARVKAEELFDELVALWQPEQAILCNVDDLRWDEDRRIPRDVVAFRRSG